MVAWLLAVGLLLWSGARDALAGTSTLKAAPDSDDSQEVAVDGVVESAGSAGFVAESYARDYSVTVEEAGRRLDRIEVLQAAMASIREVEGARVAGWGIEHGSSFGGWVWLVGDAPASDEAVRIAARFSDVVIRTGAVHSLEELEAAERHLAALWARGVAEETAERRVVAQSLVGDDRGDVLGSSRMVFSALDLEANGIEVGVDLTVSGRVRRGTDIIRDSVADSVLKPDQLSELWTGLIGVPVKVSGVQVVKHSTNVPTDTKIADILGGSPFRYCTSGFAAKQVGGDYGIVTAGHCPNYGYFYPSPPFVNWIHLPYVKGEFNARADAQFHRIPTGISYDLRDDYWCGENAEEVCDVTGIKKRADMLGDYVCHTGSQTKVSCGEITNITSNFLDREWNELIDFDPVFVIVRGPELRDRAGDSGSPLYNHAGVAYGISNIQIMYPNGRVDVLFTAIEEVEAYLDVKILTEDPSPPGPPLRVGVGIESEVVRLSWTPPPEGANRYRVFRRKKSRGDTYNLIGNPSVSSFDHPVAELLPGMEYEYRVKAVNNLDMVGPDSEIATVSIPGVDGLKAQPGVERVSVSWAEPAGDVVSYEVYRRAAVAGEPYRKVGDTEKALFVDAVSGLTPGVEYYYRVKVVGSSGLPGSWGPGSNYARAVVPAVVGLTAVVGVERVSVSWAEPAGDVVSYEVYRRAAVAGEPYRKVGDTKKALFVDAVSGLTPGVEYYYRVKVVGSSGLAGSWGPGSNYARVVAAAVGGLKATAVSGGVSVTWAKPAGDVARYEVYRRAAIRGQPYTKIGQAKSVSYSDPSTGLVPGAEYYYRVKAVGTSGVAGSWGPGSNYARVVAAAVGGLKATAVPGGVSVSWAKPAGDVARYKVYRRVAIQGQPYTEIVETTSASYLDRSAGLIRGIEYYYRVKPVGASGVVGGWGPGPNYASIRYR